MSFFFILGFLSTSNTLIIIKLVAIHGCNFDFSGLMEMGMEGEEDGMGNGREEEGWREDSGRWHARRGGDGWRHQTGRNKSVFPDEWFGGLA